jgi:signal transduction histidine kinase
VNKIRDNESRPLIDTILRNAIRLQRLSQDILDVTRIEGGLLKLNKERFDLKQVVFNTVDNYRNQIKNAMRNIIVLNEFDRDRRQGEGVQQQQEQEQLHDRWLVKGKDTILVEADKVRILQVIDNLLSNALKFTSEGTVSISVESNDKEAVVSIKDNGQGIDPEIMPKLFTKFATKSEIGGTGLGLFISKSIIESHGGKIWAENNKDTKGATFSFSLSLANNNDKG